MKPNLLRIGRTWAPVAICMALIFVFSSDAFAAPNTSSIFAPLLSWMMPGIAQETIDMLHGMLRKLGHLTEYFILASLLASAHKAQWPEQTPANRFASCVVIATLYAISDEWHQSFVPSRSASAVDVAIDASGAILGAIWSRYRARVHKDRGKARQDVK